ncbi:MAG: hypothetical protein ACRYFY_19590 [Janthinobacterium lividum]
MTRISAGISTPLMEEVDRVNKELRAKSGIAVGRTDAVRVALVVYARTMLPILGDRRIWSLNDLENAFVERLQPKQVTTTPVEAQRLMLQIMELQQKLAILMGTEPPQAAG